MAAALAVPGFLAYPVEPVWAATGEGRIVVELGGYSKWKSLDPSGISNLDALTRQSYKYSRERHGEEFRYSLGGLTMPAYDLELSCVETDFEEAGKRVFDVTVNGSTVVDDLDLYAESGRNVAWQETLAGQAPVGGVLDITFTASVGEASVSTIRLTADGETMLELAASENRHWSSYPLRFTPNARQDVHEVALGKMGSRCLLNPVPQLLGMRQSPLGSFSEDLGEMVLAFREPGGQAFCLPFTDRYPVFESVMQEDTLTGVGYVCEDPSLPFRVEVRFVAPFYPGDEKLSTAPFFYLDLEVTNTGPDPWRASSSCSAPTRMTTPGPKRPSPWEARPPGTSSPPVIPTTNESYVLPGQTKGVFEATESLAIDDDTDFTWHYADITDTSWVWASPSGYPLPYPQKAYTFRPKGYSGGEWSFGLDAGESDSRTLALSSYVSVPVLKVSGDLTYKYLYTDTSRPRLRLRRGGGRLRPGSASGRPSRRRRPSSTRSSPTLTCRVFRTTTGSLTAVAFQGYIINTWWCVNSTGERWFSVWEGNCNFHSTVDVEYNTAWFYLVFLAGPATPRSWRSGRATRRPTPRGPT